MSNRLSDFAQCCRNRGLRSDCNCPRGCNRRVQVLNLQVETLKMTRTDCLEAIWRGGGYQTIWNAVWRIRRSLSWLEATCRKLEGFVVCTTIATTIAIKRLNWGCRGLNASNSPPNVYASLIGDVLNNWGPFTVSWLSRFWTASCFRACNYFCCCNNIYLEAGFVKVMDIGIKNPVFNFHVVYKTELISNNHWTCVKQMLRYTVTTQVLFLKRFFLLGKHI